MHCEYSRKERIFNTSLNYYYYFPTEYLMRLIFHRITLGNTALKYAVQAILLSHHAHSPVRNTKPHLWKRQNVPVIIPITSLYSPTSQVHCILLCSVIFKLFALTENGSHFCLFKSCPSYNPISNCALSLIIHWQFQASSVPTFCSNSCFFIDCFLSFIH